MAELLTPDLKMLSATLTAADRAMQREGIPEETRRRVVDTVIFGTPVPFIDPSARLQGQLPAASTLYDPECMKEIR